MKKLYSVFLSLLVAAVWGLRANAETVDNYTYGFEGISGYTLAHDWAPMGWGHIIDYDDYENEYVSYKGNSSSGINGSGCLQVGSQTLYSDDYPYDAIDLLVTPVVSGHVTIMFQATNYYNSSVKFYSVTEDGTGYKRGAVISTANIPSSVYGDWIKADVDIAEPQHIGIYASNGYLDDFTADKAEIIKKPALTVKSVKSLVGDKVDCTADGKFTVSYKAVVQNTGMLDLAPGDANYSLSLVNNSNNNDTLVTVPITQSLAMDAVSDTILLSATLPYEQVSQRSRFDVKENVSGTTLYGSWVQPVPYAPVLVIKNSSKSDVDNNSEIDFGMQNGVVAKSYYIINDGAAPLTITDVSASDGFSTTLKAMTVNPHVTLPFDISMDNATPGEKEGTLTLKFDGVDDFSFKLKGNVIDGSKYFENFEDNKFAVNMIAEDGWTMSSFPQAASISGNMYCAMEDNTSDNQKLITPLLEVAEGDKFQFEAGKTTSYNCHLNVYYSSDRKNWTMVRSLSTDTDVDADKFSNTKVGSTWSSNYEMTQFVIDNIPAGKYYLAFEAGGVHLDNLYGFKPVAVAHDIYSESTDIPSSVMTNHELKATATFKNINTEAEAAGSYTATLHFGDQTISADAPQIKAGESKEFSFSVTPHSAGTVKAYIELKGDDFSVKSDEVDVTVAEEVSDNTVQIGELKDATIDAPLNPYYNHTVSELLYTADDIKLAAGSKITSIEFRGYNKEAATYSKLNVYMANTDDTSLADPFALADVSAMTSVFDGSSSIAEGGSGTNYGSSPSVTTSAKLLKLTFAEPFVYDGKSLRIVIKGDVEHFKSRIAWEATDKKTAMSANYDNSFTSYSESLLPVAYFGIVKSPVSVSGTVTDSETKAAVEGVAVTAKSGNVEYYATTDAEGKYTIDVIQDDKTYSVVATKAGYAPAKAEDVAFTDGNVVKDFSMSKANGFFIDEEDVPAKGNVNSLYTAKVKALNPETTDIAADAYTAKLYFGDDAVAEAETKAVASGEYADFNFSFYPHHTGTYNAHVEFVYGEKKTVGKTVSVEIGDEITVGSVQVGDSTSIDNSTLPMSLFFRNSESDMVYTAKQLGLNKGTIINRIRFRGYVGDVYATKTINPNIRVYIANSDEESFDENSYQMADTTKMTKIYEGQNTYTTGVSDMHNPIDVLDLAIEGGFKYTGKSIRIFVHHDCPDYLKTYFISDAKIKGQAMNRAVDDLSREFKWKSADNSGMPVMYMDVTSTATLSGKVTDKKQQPVGGAKITLSKNGIEYYATTADDGSYSMTVGQVSLVYNMDVKADGFEEYNGKDISFDEDLNVKSDVALSKYSIVSGIVLGKDCQEADDKAVALENVSVKLVSEDGALDMTATTDAEGKYSFKVLDVFGKYTLSFSKSDYKNKEVTVDGDYDDIEVPVTVLETITSGIHTVGTSGVDFTTANVKVYTLTGEKVGEGIGAAASLPRGTYIIKGNDGLVRKISVR